MEQIPSGNFTIRKIRQNLRMAEALSTATVMHGAVPRLTFSENILSEKRITKTVFEYSHEHD